MYNPSMRAAENSACTEWNMVSSDALRFDIALKICAACRHARRAAGVWVQAVMSSRAFRAEPAPLRPAASSKIWMSAVRSMHMWCHMTMQFGFMRERDSLYVFISCTCNDVKHRARPFMA